MASLICALLAVLCFILALLHAVPSVDLVVVGLLFMALAMVFGSAYVSSRWNRA